jgi:hypothetical protein
MPQLIEVVDLHSDLDVKADQLVWLKLLELFQYQVESVAELLDCQLAQVPFGHQRLAEALGLGMDAAGRV